MGSIREAIQERLGAAPTLSQSSPDPLDQTERELDAEDARLIKRRRLARRLALSELEVQAQEARTQADIAEATRRKELATAKAEEAQEGRGGGGGDLMSTMLHLMLTDSQALRQANADLQVKLIEMMKDQGEAAQKKWAEDLRAAGILPGGQTQTPMERTLAEMTVLLKMGDIFAERFRREEPAQHTPAEAALAANMTNAIALKRLEMDQQIGLKRIEAEIADKREEREFRKEELKHRQDQAKALLDSAGTVVGALGVILTAVLTGKAPENLPESLKAAADAAKKKQAPVLEMVPCPDCKRDMAVPEGATAHKCEHCGAQHTISYREDAEAPAGEGTPAQAPKNQAGDQEGAAGGGADGTAPKA